jgi:phosphoglycolate phosphatase-like HAD superfamily hydrolase
MMPRPTVLLFDVDGTLLSAAGAGRRALERAFAEHCGTPEPLQDIQFNGMTDPGIVRAGIELLGRAPEPGLISAVLDDYLPLLADELAAIDGPHVYPGVAPLLDALIPEEHLAVGLGTGNVQGGARLKLAHAGLDRYFAFGGFGSDHEDRAEVLRIGLERGAARLGVEPAVCRVIVIGDTPRDVAAATAIGATTLAVATGGFQPDVLRAAGAAWAFPDLTDGAVCDLLRDGGPG